MNNDHSISTISSEENAQNLDAIGSLLVSAAKGERVIDATTAAILASLVAQCRIYSVYRDSLNDPTSVFIREAEKIVTDFSEKTEEKSVSDAADEIMEDLRKSGINI